MCMVVWLTSIFSSWANRQNIQFLALYHKHHTFSFTLNILSVRHSTLSLTFILLHSPYIHSFSAIPKIHVAHDLTYFKFIACLLFSVIRLPRFISLCFQNSALAILANTIPRGLNFLILFSFQHYTLLLFVVKKTTKGPSFVNFTLFSPFHTLPYFVIRLLRFFHQFILHLYWLFLINTISTNVKP